MAVESEIMEKIRKILSRTENAGCTAQEAEAAYAKASALMVEHNISQHEIGDRESANWVDVAVGSVPGWGVQQNMGSGIIKKFFFVHDILCTKADGSKEYHIFGRKDNVETAKFIFVSLMRAFHSLFQEYRIRSGCPDSDKNIFVTGVAKGFSDKLSDERKAEEIQRDIVHGKAGGSTALVLKSIMAATMEKFHEAYPNSIKGHSMPKVNGLSSSLDAGYSAGRNLQINRAVGGRGQKKIG